MKKVRYFFEAILLYILFFFFKILPAPTASNIGGWIGKTIGPKLAANRKAYRHLNMAMVDMPQEKQNEIITGMWENLGRVIAEYPHLETISRDYTTVKNEGRISSLLDSGQPLVFFGGHIANWEINGATLLTHYNKAISLTYRPPNNTMITKLLDKARTLNGRLIAYPKSSESGRHIMQTLREKGALGILIDQKYNEGIEVPFFSYPAMTNPIFVQLCQKYRCPLVPVKNERVKGCEFVITPYPPLELFDEDDNPRPVIDVIKEAHTLLETWISERPEQWIWLHRRWKTD